MTTSNYQGYEVGPIRPPSEAQSLMLRVTRNCPWNRCKFCNLYKGEKFSLRSEEEIIHDIDSIKGYIDTLQSLENNGNKSQVQAWLNQATLNSEVDYNALQAALQWRRSGMESVFLQDGNSIILKPKVMLTVLKHLKMSFPSIKRITTYARSQNLARMKDNDLRMMFELGLNRIHIGLETGSDRVLELVNKGTSKTDQIVAGQKVKKSGMELSVYFMPGLGGAELSKENALETADVMNQINPDFIRIRTLAVTESSELYEELRSGRFQQLSDPELVEELRLFILHLNGINSVVKSDHILNLLQDLEGQLPAQQAHMLSKLDQFQSLSEEQQLLYIAGRRTGIYQSLDDLDNEQLRPHANGVVESNNLTPQNINAFAQTMMRRFI